MRYRTYICSTGYMEAAEEAVRRARNGEHQHQCARCMKWYWPEHKAEHWHEPRPSGTEVNHFGHLVRARRWKRPCVDCPAAHGDYEEMVATSNRIVAGSATEASALREVKE